MAELAGPRIIRRRGPRGRELIFFFYTFIFVFTTVAIIIWTGPRVVVWRKAILKLIMEHAVPRLYITVKKYTELGTGQ